MLLNSTSNPVETRQASSCARPNWLPSASVAGLPPNPNGRNRMISALSASVLTLLNVALPGTKLWLMNDWKPGLERGTVNAPTLPGPLGPWVGGNDGE